MSFCKELELHINSMPEGWRPYAIHYTTLKKQINAIVRELNDRNLLSPLTMNLSNSASGDVERMGYSFDDGGKRIKSCIKVELYDAMASSTASTSLVRVPGANTSYCFCPDAADLDPAVAGATQTAALFLTNSPLSQPCPSRDIDLDLSASPQGQTDEEPMESLVTPGARSELILSSDGSEPIDRSKNGVFLVGEDGTRTIVIELAEDTAFFDKLGKEIFQLSKLQLTNRHELESRIQELGKMLALASSPYEKDMYKWREIFQIYQDAQVFVSDQESDRSARSSEKALGQLQWFLKEVERARLVPNFRQAKSKAAFSTFLQLNSELVTILQFKELNYVAMIKLLEQHDKRTSLAASAGFLEHIHNEPFFIDGISRALTYTIGSHLLTITPQLDDYSCPICTSIAWKPIRLSCSHVFCVRCLVKAQRKNMHDCPICRRTNSVRNADNSNLDLSLMNLMRLYFPKEIKEKRKDSTREQATEEMEAFTGQRWTQSPDVCVIM